MTGHQTENDILLKIKNDKLLNESEFSRDEFPNLYNLSSAFIFAQLPIPKEKKRPEFVFLKDYYQNRKRLNRERNDNRGMEYDMGSWTLKN